MNYNYFADEIKDRLTAADVLPFYGIKINNRGFANCPFHNEKTASMKVYGGKGGYHCFGCGANGDIITFVEQYFQISFKEAVKKLNDDFALGYPLDGKIDRRKQRELSRIAYERERERNRQQQEEKAIKDGYYDALKQVNNLEKIIALNRPKNADSVPNKEFMEAISKIDQARYVLDCAEMDWQNYETRNN